MFTAAFCKQGVVAPKASHHLARCKHHMYVHVPHSCWRASFLAFCLGGRPAIYNIYVPYISCMYSMYIYNYVHIWRAARNVKNPPANNYDVQHTSLYLKVAPWLQPATDLRRRFRRRGGNGGPWRHRKVVQTPRAFQRHAFVVL